MHPLDDEAVSHDMDREPLRQYDSELERVKGLVDEYAQERPAEDEDDELQAVPTEVLQEDLDATIELAPGFRAGRVATCVADSPSKVLLAVFVAAAVSTLWVVLTPGERFSVSENLFIAQGAVDVRRFYELNHVDTAETYHGYRRALSAGRDAASDAAAELASGGRAGVVAGGVVPGGAVAGGSAAQRRLAATDEHDAVTLVYERRGLGASNMLDRRQLKEMHDFERGLFAWADEQQVCWANPTGGPASHGCNPIDSLLNYLYPSAVGSAGSASLFFDGRLNVSGDGGCTLPPFGDDDVAETVSWLEAVGCDGFLSVDAPPEVLDTASSLPLSLQFPLSLCLSLALRCAFRPSRGKSADAHASQPRAGARRGADGGRRPRPRLRRPRARAHLIPALDPLRRPQQDGRGQVVRARPEALRRLSLAVEEVVVR